MVQNASHFEIDLFHCAWGTPERCSRPHLSGGDTGPFDARLETCAGLGRHFRLSVILNCRCADRRREVHCMTVEFAGDESDST